MLLSKEVLKTEVLVENWVKCKSIWEILPRDVGKGREIETTIAPRRYVSTSKESIFTDYKK